MFAQSLLVAFIALTPLISFASESSRPGNIIRTTAPIISVKEGTWVSKPLVSEWEKTGDINCGMWSPAANVMDNNIEFTQTRTCSTQETRTITPREYHTTTHNFRFTGQPVLENRTGSQTETQQAIGTNTNNGLVVMNGKPGVNGIYQVRDKVSGKVFNAYVNMVDDGGNWVLVLYWVNSSSIGRIWNEMAVKNAKINPWTANSTIYPVIPAGITNKASRALLVSGNADWKKLFGAWQSFPMFDSNFSFTSSGFTVKTPSGNKTMHTRSSGWQQTTNKNQYFGFWTVWGNSGPCGGANKAATSRICPSTKFGTESAHTDMSSNKFFYIKAD